MGESVFKSCSKLSSVTLSNKLDTIPKNTFELCTGLTSFTITDNIKTIDENAFTSSGLTTVTIPKTVETINSKAFSNSKLELLNYPTKEIEVNPNIFEGCQFLTKLNITGDEVEVSHIPNYEKDKQPWHAINYRIASITLSGKIETIGNYAFEGTTIKEIDLEGVKTIGENAFTNTGLTKVKLPTSVTTINKEAFSNCLQLTSVEYPISITTYSNDIFTGSDNIGTVTIHGSGEMKNYIDKEQPWYTIRDKNIQTIKINDGITSISTNAFKGMTSVKNI